MKTYQINEKTLNKIIDSIDDYISEIKFNTDRPDDDPRLKPTRDLLNHLKGMKENKNENIYHYNDMSLQTMTN